MSNTVYFRWLTELEKQIHCRKHIILYGNIHDEFLWRDERQTVYKIINTSFNTFAKCRGGFGDKNKRAFVGN